nr:bifunctional dTDP-4-dehydrorhamnose 3,5-epimerase/dTDP-4-dehydrorhamnose reductase-like [Ipomoea batatas]
MENQKHLLKFLIYGKTGMIGGMLGKLCEKQGIPFEYGKARLEDRSQLLSDIIGVNPTHVFNAAGATGTPNADWCEFNKVETIRSNVIGALNLADVCEEKGVLLLHFGSGCIYDYDSEHPMGSGIGFTEQDQSNYDGSFYSKTKGMVEYLLGGYNNICILRVKMPLVSDLNHPRNFIKKIIGYEKVVNIPNSMSVLDELLPVAIEMAKRNCKGIGISPTQESFPTMSELDSSKLKREFPELLGVKESETHASASKNQAHCYNERPQELSSDLPSPGLLAIWNAGTIMCFNLGNSRSKVAKPRTTTKKQPIKENSVSSLELSSLREITVRIVHPGGREELFQDAISASIVLERYPGMAVAKPGIFKHPNESVLAADDRLLPGQKYYIVPSSTVEKLKRRHSRRVARAKRAAVRAKRAAESGGEDEASLSVEEEVTDVSDEDSFSSAKDYYFAREEWPDPLNSVISNTKGYATGSLITSIVIRTVILVRVTGRTTMLLPLSSHQEEFDVVCRKKVQPCPFPRSLERYNRRMGYIYSRKIGSAHIQVGIGDLFCADTG